MYQMDITGNEAAKITPKFLIHYVKEDEIHSDIHLAFFHRLVSHFSEVVDFDSIISANLMKNKSIYTVPSLSKSIIKVAMVEMMFEKTDIPVIINEYVNVSKYFSDKKESSFINAILDKISKTIERKAKCQENN